MGACPCFAGAAKVVEEKKPIREATVVPPKKEKSSAPAAGNAAGAKDARIEEVQDPKNLVFKEPTQKAPAEAAPEPAPAPIYDVDWIRQGACLEVFSNSYSAWCPGVVHACDSNSVLLAYQVPGEPVDANISTKTLPIDSTEIRSPEDTGSWLSASVEVYSYSNKAWCLGKVTQIQNGLLSVVFFYPNEPPDAVPVMKQLQLGDKDLRLRGIDAALAFPAGGLGHETLQVGDPVEVYSNSLGVWCGGFVANLADGVATINFFYPDMDKEKDAPATKELPLGHQDLRLPDMGGGFINDGPPVTEADCAVGKQLEIFSASRGQWLFGRISQIADGNVTVQIQYPDMEGQVFEKVVPIGDQTMRLAA